MQCERDVLIKDVMPRLQDYVRNRGLEIRPIDLRWGVVKGATTRQTLEACFEELDECREITGMPYVVGIIGQRYGWVLKEQDDDPKMVFPTDIRQKYVYTYIVRTD
jgi:hypothetical protein